jgi:hypothetical protein
MRGHGRVIFAGVLLLVGAVLNVGYGIAAISNSKVYVHNAHYVFGSLKTWGWVGLILGIVEFLAALSLLRGNTFGRVFGIVVGGLAAIEALFSLPAYPFWSLAVFALSLWIIHGLAIYGSELEIDPNVDVWTGPSSSTPVVPHPPM